MNTIDMDCHGCRARGPACHDCVVSVLLGAPDQTGLTEPEVRALGVLADQGLVPPLRLLPGRAVSPGGPVARDTRPQVS